MLQQILGRWCVQRNIVLVAKTVHKERMKENMAVFDFQLDEEDMKRLDGLTTPESLAVRELPCDVESRR